MTAIFQDNPIKIDWCSAQPKNQALPGLCMRADYYEHELSLYGEQAGDFCYDGTKYGRAKMAELEAHIREYSAACNQTISVIREILRIDRTELPFFIEYTSKADASNSFWPSRLIEELTDEFLDENISTDEKQKRIKARRLAQKHVELTSCEVCGIGKNRPHLLHRHHYDYDKPVDVFILCHKDHFALHTFMRRANLTFTKQETSEYIKANGKIRTLSSAASLKQLSI
jgi:hypothetical protein